MSLVDEENQIDVDDADLVAPPVVVVVVTHDPGPWFDEVLTSLAAQDYPALSVLVIDAASAADPTERVAAVLPESYVRRLDANPGFGAAANEVLGVVEGAAFYLVCHDDVALAPDAVRTMVQEAYRSNAGIVGPKLVMWDEPGRLLQVGLQVDKSAHEVQTVERGELDQEQHDAVRDVFAVPGGATLVRSDLFAALGGFEPSITFLGEDVDLCWRAQVAGSRVLVVPAAVARHREALGDRGGFAPHQRRQLVLQHRLRAVLANYSTFHRLRVMPQVALLAVAEVLYASLAGRRRLAAAIVDAWRWNRRQRPTIRASRQRLAALRTVPDSEVRRLQSRGSARFALLLRGQLGRGGDDRVKALTRSAGDLAGSLRRGPLRTTVTVWAAIALVLLVGSRHHLWSSPRALVDLPQLPGRPWDLVSEWLSGWRRAGLGSEAPQPTAYGLLGLTGTVLVGSTELLRRLLVLVPLALGPIGAARLAGATRSRRAPWVAGLTYAAIPLPYNALAAGRWGGLVVWSVTPWIVSGLARAGGDGPYEPEPGESMPSRWRSVLALGLGAAAVAAIEPLAMFLPVVLAALLALGGALAGRLAGAGRLLAAGGGATLVAFGLHLPWSFDLVGPGATWAALAGPPSTAAAPEVAELFRFETGTIGAGPLGFVFLVAAALPLLIGKSWRLGWAVRGWVLAAAGWAAAVVAGADGTPFALGPIELLLAPAACGLALAVALGMVAFEVDLPGYRFGWRQVASIAAAACITAGTVPVVLGAFDGDWDAPADGVASVLGFLDVEQASEGPFRTLWLGDPSVLPLTGWDLDAGAAGETGWALTDRGLPNVLDRWPGSPDGPTRQVADALVLASDRETARLGRLLGPLGIRYIVVVEADRPIVGSQVAAPPNLVGSLDEQLDLAEIGVDAGLRVYRNAAWIPARAELVGDEAREAASGPLLEVAGVGLREVPPALETIDGVARYTGAVEDDAVIWHSAAASDRWSLRVAGESAERDTGFGFGNRFAVGGGGDATLSYSTPLHRLALPGVQAAAWVVVALALGRARRRDRAAREALATSGGWA